MGIKATHSLSLSEAFSNATSKIVQFHGRSRRSEYWWTMAIVYLISLILTPIVGMVLSIATIPITFRRLHDTGRSGWWWGAGAILQFAFIVSVIYDIVMAGMNTNYIYGNEPYFVYSFITKYIIWILMIAIYKVVMLIFMCLDSDQYENDYGESPKYVDCDSE